MPMSDNYNLYLINYIEQGRIQDVSQGGGRILWYKKSENRNQKGCMEIRAGGNIFSPKKLRKGQNK